MAKSNYITRQGWNVLDQELKFLWKEERPKVTQAVSDAAALGDRSENAEYIYGKRRLREIDRRVRFLTKRLEVLQIVDYSQSRLVGCDEFDPAKNWISIDSPVARALIGKEEDDEITVETPSGKIQLYVNRIWYEKV